MKEIPFVAFGNDELASKPLLHIGDTVIVACGHEHTLFGDDNGGDLLLFYKCDEQLYLGALKNRLIAGPKG